MTHNGQATWFVCNSQMPQAQEPATSGFSPTMIQKDTRRDGPVLASGIRSKSNTCLNND